MTVFINMHILTTYSRHMSCHGYKGVMSVLCTPLQVKCYHFLCLMSHYITWRGGVYGLNWVQPPGGDQLGFAFQDVCRTLGTNTCLLEIFIFVQCMRYFSPQVMTDKNVFVLVYTRRVCTLHIWTKQWPFPVACFFCTFLPN